MPIANCRLFPQFWTNSLRFERRFWNFELLFPKHQTITDYNNDWVLEIRFFQKISFNITEKMVPITIVLITNDQF
ncbi:MAG: hypothetical protein DRR08_05160 [Candidatus Parabeggiatoa sp. nov. 2]|nr:MAG: hypothetical protein B6247_18435 [Beggiatoa sp. 4572_84]RKZ62757.1 MAG: hypothetical protein DRR08_05160 [Gammaproteobacteria bacterium]